MKAVMIVYNQAHSAEVQNILDKCDVRGFTKWEDVQGRGSKRGEPHYSSHAWPSKNMATLTFVDEGILSELLAKLKALDERAEKQGLRTFIWEAEQAW